MSRSRAVFGSVMGRTKEVHKRAKQAQADVSSATGVLLLLVLVLQLLMVLMLLLAVGGGDVFSGGGCSWS